MDISFLQDKKIHIIGLGKTGLATAKFFQKNNFIVSMSVWDDDIEKREQAIREGFEIDDCQILNPNNDVIIWSPGIPHYGVNAHPISIRARANNIPLISDIDILCRALPDQTMIAITGTNGKSTTTALIKHVMQEFVDTRMGGNIGDAVLGLEPMDSDGVYVLECSSYQLELTPHLKPHVAILLNITPDHLEYHGGLDAYIAAKEKIFANTQNDSRQKIAVIGQDTTACINITERLRAKEEWKIIPISTKQKLDNGVWVNASGELFDLDGFVVNLNKLNYLKGEHNFENIAACYAAIRYGFDFDSNCYSIIEAISRFKGLPHRQFLCRTIGKTKFINDSKATNADAAEKALKTYKNIYWIAGGQAKNGGLSGLEIYKDRIKYTALIGNAALDFSKFLAAHEVPHTISITLEQAIKDLWALAQNDREDSVILLSPACASWDQFKSFEQRGEIFETFVTTLSETKN